MVAYYTWIKIFHITCVTTSVSLFAIRGAWILGSGRKLWRWLKIVPHFVDTLLLASGLTMAFMIHQLPFVNSEWLTAKVIGLIVYIMLGMLVFRSQRSRTTRWSIWVMALIVFGYIVSVALTKNPTGFFAGIA